MVEYSLSFYEFMKKNGHKPVDDIKDDDEGREDYFARLDGLVESDPEFAAKLQRLRQAVREDAKRVNKVEMAAVEKELTPEGQKHQLGMLKSRFHDPKHMKLHGGVLWADVEKALKASPEKLWSLQQLEATGGEPDVIGEDKDEFVFGDCSTESPPGRRNVVFDRAAEEYLKERYPGKKINGNAVDMAAEYGVDLMDEEQYRVLQKKLQFDRNTWSWLKTPSHIRKNGFALDGSYHSRRVPGSQAGVRFYRSNRGFRAVLRVKKV